MSMSLIGVLPVSGLNIGVQAALPGLALEVTSLQEMLAKLALSLAAQLEVSINIPQLPSISAGIAAQIAAIPSSWNPANLFSCSLDAQADIGIELGLVTAQLAIVGEIVGSFSAGLDVPGLSAWSYAGRSASFGDQLASQTATGWQSHAPTDNVQGLVLATESFDSWGNFSGSFNTGRSSLRKVDPTKEANLTYMGTLGGGQLNTGVLDLFLPINLFLLELEALKLNLQFSLEAAIGINLPDLTLLLDILANLSIDVMLDNLINVSVDIGASIAFLELQISFLLDLQASLSIDAGGLALWSYSGPASGFGSSLQEAIADGVPGGSGPDAAAYGMAIATKLPAAWAGFGLIFLTK